MLDYKLKPNSKILIFNTRLSNNNTTHFSVVQTICFKSLNEGQSDSIKTLNTIFNSLNVHVSDFCIIGQDKIRTIIHISVLSEEEKIITIIKDFYLSEINMPTKIKFKNEIYKLIRSYKTKYDKFV